MNATFFLVETLQVLATELAGIAAVAVILYGYVKMMHSHRA